MTSGGGFNERLLPCCVVAFVENFEALPSLFALLLQLPSFDAVRGNLNQVSQLVNRGFIYVHLRPQHKPHPLLYSHTVKGREEKINRTSQNDHVSDVHANVHARALFPLCQIQRFSAKHLECFSSQRPFFFFTSMFYKGNYYSSV